MQERPWLEYLLLYQPMVGRYFGVVFNRGVSKYIGYNLVKYTGAPDSSSCRYAT